MMDVKQMNALTLAYIGDAVLELYVRRHLLEEGLTKPNDLHHRAVKYVSAEAQASVLYRLLDSGTLNEAETAVVRRGRNAKPSTVPKNTEVQTYKYGTAFEALIGFHHLNGDEDRVFEIIKLMFAWIEEGDSFAE